MNDRKIRQSDFILITDPIESSRYLKIGEVTNIEFYSDGSVKEYTVRFRYDFDTSQENLE